MENIEFLQKLFREKGILNSKNGRKFCYKKLLESDKELLDIWNIFLKNYRTEEEAWFSLSHLSEPPKCPICGKLCKFTGITKYGGNGYNTTCGDCSANAVQNKLEKFSKTIKKRTSTKRKEIFEKRKNTCLKIYGDENYSLFGSQSFKDNLYQKYGDEHYSNKEKACKTCIEKYGVDTVFRLKGFKEESLEKKKEKYGNASNYKKTKKTNIEKYGVEHVGQSKEIQEKMSLTKENKSKLFEEQNDCTCIKTLFKKFGSGWKQAKIIDSYITYNGRKYVSNKDIYKIENYWNSGRCHTNNYVSKKEKELYEYIKSIYSGTIIENDTSSVPNLNHRYFELDIFLPHLNIAFDFDGNYYHSSKFKDENYHQRKTLCCYKVNIKLAHILEYDWDNSKEIVKDKIKRLIFKKESFNDGFFPSFDKDIKLSKPRKHIIGEYVYYDTGVLM